jgi:hypothetical protein
LLVVLLMMAILTEVTNLFLNSPSSCISPRSAGIVGMKQHSWLVMSTKFNTKKLFFFLKREMKCLENEKTSNKLGENVCK